MIIAGPAVAEPALPQASDPWYQAGQAQLARNRAQGAIAGPAKNIILFIGDGMDLTTITAARIHEAQRRGADGEGNLLSFERFPQVALAKTYTTDQQTPDSAGTATAMLTGVKTKSGVLGVSDAVTLGDCQSAQASAVTTLLELAEDNGHVTGIVTTTRLTHATPASAYAHSPHRNWENDSEMPDEATRQGCLDIARQLAAFSRGNGIEIALGGGRANFLPRASLIAPTGATGRGTGRRTDGRDLIDEWQNNHAGGRYISTARQLEELSSLDKKPVLGLFANSHMAFEIDRQAAGTANQEPSLSAMTAKAIELLSAHDKGFFLLVEGGRIDHAHHAGQAARALSETIEFANAVRAARAMTSEQETLIIVTADHAHTLTFAGYATRGQDILGLANGRIAEGDPISTPVLAADGKPYTSLSYANGPGARPGRRPNLSKADTASPVFRQPALVPLGSETHGGEDVVIYSAGPLAHLLTGVVEQNYIFHVMKAAFDF